MFLLPFECGRTLATFTLVAFARLLQEVFYYQVTGFQGFG